MYEGKYVIVRGDRSGVFAGTLKAKEGRDHFAQEHGLSMDDPMTPEEFIQLTKDAYGGAVIIQLAAYYGEEE